MGLSINQEKLRRKLAKLGYDVVYIDPASGYWRSQDVYRLEGYAVRKNPVSGAREEVRIASDFTLRDCANKRIEVNWCESGRAFLIDVVSSREDQ